MKPQPRGIKSSTLSQESIKDSLSTTKTDDTSGLFDDILSILAGKAKFNSLTGVFFVIFCVFSLGFLTTIVYLPKHDLLHDNPLKASMKRSADNRIKQEAQIHQNKQDIYSNPFPAKPQIQSNINSKSITNLRSPRDPPKPPPPPPSQPTKTVTTIKTPNDKDQIPLVLSSTRDVNSFGLESALLIIAANRPQYLEKTLSYILQYHPKKSLPIIISHDGNYESVNRVITKYQQQFKETSPILFDSILFTPSPSNKQYENGYYRLADHFKFALNSIFQYPNYSFQRVIIVEEDLQIACDFFEYFAALFPYLDDPNNNLLTISAWNDNGFTSLVKNSKQIYRSDFFPGLGWMMTRSLWEKDLGPKWPRAYWDDWLREPKNRQGRQILRPEISRTLHFGAQGVSHAQYSEYLTSIKLNDQCIEFTKLDHNYLLPDRWDEEYLTHVKEAKIATMGNFAQILQMNPNIKEIKIYYGSIDENSMEADSYRRISQWSGVMNNVKAGVPRTAYKGIVSFWKNNVKVHLVPKSGTF